MFEVQPVDTDQIVMDFMENLPCWNVSIPAEARLAWIGLIAAYRSPARVIVKDGSTEVAHDVFPSVG